jgi:hypothetical protein
MRLWRDEWRWPAMSEPVYPTPSAADSVASAPPGGADLAPFDARAHDVMQRLQRAFADVLSALNPSDRGAELAARLGIDKKLAWRAASLATASEPLLAGEYLPGQDGLEIFLSACHKAGVAPALTARVRACAADFHQLERDYAGDRPTLEAMLTSLTGFDRDNGRAHLLHRRSAFKAQAALWGVQCRATLRADFLYPSAGRPGIADLASLRAFVDLARLRPGIRWSVSRSKATDGGRNLVGTGRGPMDQGAAAKYGAPLIERFCSRPMPRVQSVPSSGDIVNNMVADWPMGMAQRATVVTGEWAEAIGPVGLTGDGPGYNQVFLRAYTPSELLVFDMLVHRKLMGRLSPTLHCFSDLGLWPAYPEGADQRSTYPVPERVDYLGRGLESAELAEVPAYTDMLAYCCQQRSWSAADLDVYRVRMAYPPIPCVLAVRSVPGA